MLNIEVRIAQPLAGLAVAPGANEASEHPEQASVVLGLALRCKEAVPVEVNLIPPAVLESMRRRQQAFYWVLSLMTLFLIMASIVPVTQTKTKLEEDRIARLKRVLVQYDPALQNNPTGRSIFEDEFMFVDNDVQGYMADLENIDSMYNGRTFWLDYLKAVSDAIPIGGGIGISSFETAVFGGITNTGAEAKLETEERRKVILADPDNAGAPEYASTMTIDGFSGIDPPRGGSGFAIGGPAGDPNGVIIYGYATEVDILREFVERLRESDAFVEEGVYFYVNFLDEVPVTDLDNARTAGGGSSSGGGAAGGAPVLSFGGGGKSSSTGAGSRGGSAGGSFVGSSEGNVILFHIDLQFYGKPLNLGLEDPWHKPKV